MNSEKLLLLAQNYSNASDLRITTVSTYASGSGDFFNRLTEGKDVTIRRVEKITQWFSDNWPIDLAWPAQIERPTPAADSPFAQAQQAQIENTEPNPLYKLNEKQQIANPDMLCDVLRFDIAVYRNATKQYAIGKPRAKKLPRRGSDLSVMVFALALIGDARFSPRKEMVQLNLTFNSELKHQLRPILEAA